MDDNACGDSQHLPGSMPSVRFGADWLRGDDPVSSLLPRLRGFTSGTIDATVRSFVAASAPVARHGSHFLRMGTSHA